MSVQPVPHFPTHTYAGSGASASRPPMHPQAPIPIPIPIPIRRYAGLRVGDSERTEVCDLLARYFAEGRLTPDELDDRLAVATSAVTQADLSGLLSDLPRDERRRPLHPQGAAAARPVVAPATGGDVLTWIGVVSALGLIMVMMLALGLMSPLMFVGAAFGGMVALGLGGGLVHLMHRSVDRRRPPAA